MQSLEGIVRDAYLNIASMSPDTENVKVKSFCENVFSTVLTNLYFTYSVDLVHLLSIFDLEKPISPSMSYLITALLNECLTRVLMSLQLTTLSRLNHSLRIKSSLSLDNSAGDSVVNGRISIPFFGVLSLELWSSTMNVFSGLHDSNTPCRDP